MVVLPSVFSGETCKPAAEGDWALKRAQHHIFGFGLPGSAGPISYNDYYSGFSGALSPVDTGHTI